MEEIPFYGLTNEEVLEARKTQGSNILFEKGKNGFLIQLLEILKEPMLVILLVASLLYFLLSQWGDGLMLVVAIFKGRLLI